MTRRWLLLLVGGILAFSSACSNEAEIIVERWETLADIIAENGDDCDALATELAEFRQENADTFSANMRPLYDEIEQDPALRMRLEHTFARLEVQDFSCQSDEQVQNEARALFDELLKLTPKD